MALVRRAHRAHENLLWDVCHAYRTIIGIERSFQKRRVVARLVFDLSGCRAPGGPTVCLGLLHCLSRLSVLASNAVRKRHGDSNAGQTTHASAN